MKANELRIDNYVYCNYSGVMQVCSINPNKNTANDIDCVHLRMKEGLPSGFYKLDDIKAIPLTEEWLLKFGFEIKDKVNGGYLIQINYDHQKEYLYCSKRGTIALWSDVKKADFIIMNSAKYVHQLQNLYFALTGKELEIDDKDNPEKS